jgi:hypothetical protein
MIIWCLTGRHFLLLLPEKMKAMERRVFFDKLSTGIPEDIEQKER